MNNQVNGLEIAVIGMVGRFPGAKTIDEFWNNIKNGIESILFFSDEELRASGVPEELLKNSNYIKARGIIGDIEYFDALFFDYTPREAEMMDPQTRISHECAWEVLEHAGYDPNSFQGVIGLYTGASPNPYWEFASSSIILEFHRPSDQFATAQLSEKDFLSTRVSYKLNLKGSSFILSTACSTSLVAIHLACNGILAGDCDMALAGGVSVMLPEKVGYLYEEAMILSADGHNRTFDEKATGSVFGDGVGFVLLKRLDDARADGDTIHAIIKGSAINNDGNRKLGYTAPSVEGQAEVIRTALQMAEVEPESIAYLETHGTATSLGDVVEIGALKRAFANVNRKNTCALGTVKTNVGHLNSAAGVTGIIKTIMALKHRLIPPGLFFETPNSRIDFENSPFYVNTRLQEWKNHQYPLRAGVSSFGIGGTNVHVILEEWPGAQGAGRLVQSAGREYQLILLSARTETALDRMTENLAQYLEKNRNINFPDVAYTLQVGRRAFPYRKMTVCPDVDEVLNILSPGANRELSSPVSREVHSFFREEKEKTVIFMFAGLGDQYVNMARDLYEKETLFQEEMNRCFEILEGMLDYDLKETLYPLSGSSYNRSNRSHESNINQTEIAQLVVFIIEYALARLLILWGIEPGAMIGYSFGEYAAACIAGVMSLDHALKLVVNRGRLMEQTPEGAMLSVPLAIEQLKPLVDMNDQLSIAIDNGASCVIAGPPDSIEAFEKQMKQKRLICIRLETAYAVHSPLMAPILTEFQKVVRQIPLNPPNIPYISNVTGDWLTEQEALHPEYWTRHLQQTVRFSEGLSRLLEKEEAVFLEIGPGRALSNHVKQQEKGKENNYPVVNFLRHPEESIPDIRYLLNKIGHLWLWGVKIDWQAFYGQEKRHRTRIPLPTYPFERQRFWMELPSGRAASPAARQGPASPTPGPGKQPDISKWFYFPSWEPSWLPEAYQTQEQEKEKEYVLIFMDECGLGLELAASLAAEGHYPVPVKKGKKYVVPGNQEETPGDSYIIDPAQPDHFRMLLKEVCQRHQAPARILYLWGVTNSRESLPGIETMDLALDRYFYSLIFLARAIGDLHRLEDIHLLVLTDNMQDVSGEEILCPEKAPDAPASKVISQEYYNITCRSIDILVPAPGHPKRKKLVRQLTRELTAGDSHLEVAYRNGYRWVQAYKPISIPGAVTQNSRLRPGGVYLITGGLGGIGHVLAKHLAATLKARLVLTGRTVLPEKNQWDRWLSTQPQDDGISRKIREVQELEALGAEVLVFDADVANEQQMRSLISRAEERLGTINGVIHTAGIVGKDSMFTISEIDKRQCQLNFQAKTYGVLVLEKVLREKRLDFCLLMSSISSVLGGLGLAAYSAANRFMDAFTRLLNRENPVPWISVDWDGWRTPGAHQDKGLSAAAWEDFAMTPEQGIESVRRILSLQEPDHGHVVHSTGDLQARIEQWLNLESLRRKKGPGGKATGLYSYARPDLSNPYIAPRNKLEAIIAGVWQEFLGIQQVGTDDNFFDLNATSLDIVRVNNILRDVLKKDIPAVTMFKYPTVGTLARFLDQEIMSGEASREKTDRKEVIHQGQDRVRGIRMRVKKN